MQIPFGVRTTGSYLFELFAIYLNYFCLKIYAPLDVSDATHHRMLYVFACRQGNCLKNHNSYKVLRAQLPQHNRYFVDYELESDDEDDELKLQNRFEDSRTLCVVCGCYANKFCSVCKKVFYCSKEHQKLDWRMGHSTECKDFEGINTSSLSEIEAKLKQIDLCQNLKREKYPIIFDEWELVTEDEREILENSKDPKESKINQMIDQYYDTIKDEKKKKEIEQSNIDESQINQIEVDKEFLNFQDRIRLEPEQVIRYTTNLNDQPLWISSEGKDPKVPNCEYCGSERVFELQILPQLLFYLKPDRLQLDIDKKNFEPMEWGTLIIYTCKNSCNSVDTGHSKESAYLEEFLHQQVD